MNEKENKETELEVIDLGKVVKKLLTKKKRIAINMAIAFVLSCIYILSIPRLYTTSAAMAPEIDKPTSTAGTLGDIASSFGIDLSNMQTSDAISPLLYPDLMKDNGFIAELFNIHVISEDGNIDTTYYQYLKKYQQRTWWSKPILWIGSLISSTMNTKKVESDKFDPYNPSRNERNVMTLIRNYITMTVDKKTAVITLTVKDQDALICKTIADSTRAILKHYITSYRTNKARRDLDYYKKLTAKAKHDYEKARQLYGSYSDANMDVILQSHRLKQEDLENDMQIKFNTYSALNTQLEAARGKVVEKTPAFTLLQGAEVPFRPSYPKRILFVLGMLILTFFCTALWLVRKDLHLTL